VEVSGILCEFVVIDKERNEWGIMQERILFLGDLKYVQIHDLDDNFNNSRVHCIYDLDYK